MKVTTAETVGSVNGSVNPLLKHYFVDSRGLWGIFGGQDGNRTRVIGFANRCLTTWLPDLLTKRSLA